MDLNRAQTLFSFDHAQVVEWEHEDGYRFWERGFTMSTMPTEAPIGYGWSDIDHASDCPCGASWDEWIAVIRLWEMARP